MADADASFRTDMLETSFGLMSEMLPSYGTPSTIIRGELLALIDPTPRMRIVEALEAGSPLEEIICTPGVVPARALVTLVAIFFSIVFSSTTAAEPVKASLVDVP